VAYPASHRGRHPKTLPQHGLLVDIIIQLVHSGCWWCLHYHINTESISIRCGQNNYLILTLNHSPVSLHPVRTQNDIYTSHSQHNRTHFELYPLKERLAKGHHKVACIPPPDEATSTGSFMTHKVIPCSLTNACEALESKRMVAGMEMILNILSITSGTSCVVSADT
jgi:hypothetical protein